MKLGARIVCGRTKANGNPCKRVVPEDGKRCFAHSKAGLRMRRAQAVLAEANLIAAQSERVRAAKEETEILLIEEARLRDVRLTEQRELRRVKAAIRDARKEHDALVASIARLADEERVLSSHPPSDE